MKFAAGCALSILFCACASAPGGDPPQSGSGQPSVGGSTSGSETTGASGSTSATTGSTSAGRSGAESGFSSSGSSGFSSSGSSGSSATSGEIGRSGSSGAIHESGTASGSSGGSSGASGAGSASGSTAFDAGAEHRDAAAVVLTGCAAQVPMTVFAASCEGTPCHNSKDRAYALDLQSAGVASRLVNVPSIEEPILKLIDPDNPMNSFLLLKVELAQPPAGSQMPEVGAKLNSTQIDCLQKWVAAEAAGPY